MRQVIKHLREGWYGNGNLYSEDHPLNKKPVDCRKLWKTCLDIAGTKFVSLCDGISGKMGELVETIDFTNEPVSIPIDTLVVDLTRDEDVSADWGTVHYV